MSKERPVRAGAPTYGQPVSPATQTFQKVQKEEELMSPASTAAATLKIGSPEVMRHTGIIDKITLSFKGNSEREEPGVEQVIDLGSLDVASGEESSEEGPQSLDLYA